MISYDPFWNTLKSRGLTKYALYTRYNISKQTIWRMSKGKPIVSSTIEELCKILDCKIEDILVYIPDVPETESYFFDSSFAFNEDSSDYEKED